MIKGFSPVFSNNTEYLVLGSMPSTVSLEKKEYYGHKNNHFWKIICSITSCGDLSLYKDKLQMLENNRIGLWDVIALCNRKGSRDDRISEPEVNDLKGLFRKCSRIKVIFLNGRKAETIFKEHFGDIGIDAVYLPSTSPLNTMKLTDKTNIWKKAFEKYGFKGIRYKV